MISDRNHPAESIAEFMAHNDDSFRVSLTESYKAHGVTLEQYAQKLSKLATIAYEKDEERGVIKGMVIGYTSNLPDDNGSFITQVATSKEYRRQGVCSRLLKEYTDICVKKNIDYIWLYTWKYDNDSTINVYRSAGFVIVGDADNDMIRMEKRLKPKNILVTRSSMPSFEEYINEIKEIWDTRWLTNMGVKHKQLEKELKGYLDVDKIDLFTNGHMALELTLQAMNLSGEVITTPFTFASTTHAIVRNGLKPVFCDIDPDTYTIDTSKLESLITDRTSAIVPVHVYGNICDIDEIDRIARKYGLKVIYDAAHAFGETYNGKGVGNFGDAAMFSFHATKVFHTIEGGCVCFKDEQLGRNLYELKNFGIHGPEEVSAVGANAKMNEFCAAMGICNLRHLDGEIEKRRKVTERYRERLEGREGIRLNTVRPGVKSNYAYFPVIFDEKVFGKSREEVFEALAKEGIGARKYFYPLTNTFSAFHGAYDPGDTPAALHISKRVLTLPLYADLSIEDVDRICDIILE